MDKQDPAEHETCTGFTITLLSMIKISSEIVSFLLLGDGVVRCYRDKDCKGFVFVTDHHDVCCRNGAKSSVLRAGSWTASCNNW